MSDTLELIRKSQAGDADAREALITENSGLIWAVVRRFAGRGTEMDDLYQLGCLGFLKAVDGFDLEFGTQFSTYAVPKIAGEIRRFLRDDGAVKVSRGVKERASAIKVARNQLICALGREPTVSEIAEKTGFSPEDIATAELATASIESIQQQTGDDGFTLESVLTDTKSEDALLERLALSQAIESIQQQTGDDGFTLESVLTDTKSEDALLERLALSQAIECLQEREAIVIKLRYYHGLTQERAAKVLGVSQVQVSRIEKKALTNLKSLLS